MGDASQIFDGRPAPAQLRVIALQHAVTVAMCVGQPPINPDNIIAGAAKFEAYLKGEVSDA